jgi:hypothetical protein
VRLTRTVPREAAEPAATVTRPRSFSFVSAAARS